MPILRYFLTGSLVILMAFQAGAQKKWNLEDCILYALDNNIQIKQSELTSASNKADLLQKKLDLLPTLNGNASSGWGWGRSPNPQTNIYTIENTNQQFFSVSSGITLFNGLQKYNAIKKAQLDLEASRYDSDKMRDDIALMIAGAYLQILFSNELVKTTADQVDITKQQIERTRKLVDAGTLARGDLLDIQSQGAREEVNFINAQNQLNLAYLDLLQILDLPASEPFEIDVPNIQIRVQPELMQPEQVFKYAVINLPEVRSAEYRLQSASKSLSITRGYRSPTLSMNGSWSTTVSDQIRDNFLDPNSGTMPFEDQIRNNENKSLSIGLSIPIFNGFQVSTGIQQSKMGVEFAEYDLQLVKNTVRKNVETAYTDAMASYKTYQANLKSLESFREAFKYMEQKFNVGLVNSLDYNTAKTQLTRAESDLLSAKYDYVFKTKILDFYMGKPITMEDFIVK